MRFALIATTLFASTSFAAPRPGANHHLGDDSFVAEHGRAPRRTDTEHERMRVHLEHVRDQLAAAPATRPELAKRRAELLGYLADYIAKGTVPSNAELPWRTPVFIDEAGAICAVGYLIERSAGRELPERIAAAHRYDFLEDIAAAMPEVQAWVASSGLTLEELASIQPAYAEADVETWRTWDLAKLRPADGPFEENPRFSNGEHRVTGTFQRRRMEGEWRAISKDTVVGKGKLRAGRGTWESFFADGKTVLARGPYVANRAHGAWQFFHPSGNLAAEGSFDRGDRAGAWRFYYDTPAKTPIASGRFSNAGYVIGTWQHFDANGALLARTRTETPTHWRRYDSGGEDGGAGHILDIVPGENGVHHVIHAGTVALQRGDLTSHAHTLESLSKGREHLYVYASGFAETAIMFDANGFKLERGTDGWTAARCRWSDARKRIAKAGDLARLHNVLYSESRIRSVTSERHDTYTSMQVREHGDPGPACGDAKPIAAERAAKLDVLLATRDQIRTPPPKFVRQLALGEADVDDVDPDAVDDVIDPDETPGERGARLAESDHAHYLAAHMITYLEWPHVDGKFIDVFETMPGRRRCWWTDPCDEAGPN